jgi:septum formation protein
MSSVLDITVPLVLASKSPRRRELLALLNGAFAVCDAAVNEAAVAEPARAKARAANRPGTTTVAADTRVRVEGSELGKPRDVREATAMLLRLSGRQHEVVTDVAVVDGAGRDVHFSVRSRVTMRPFDRAEAARYAVSGDGLDAAGAYKIQGAARALVESFDGCFANVVGFPLCHAYEALRWAGRAFPARPEVACQRHFTFVCPVWRRAQAQGRSLRNGASFASWSEQAITRLT